MDDTNDICYIDGKEDSLSNVEKMGIDNFCFSAYNHQHKSLFKYYPNTKQYVKEEKNIEITLLKR